MRRSFIVVATLVCALACARDPGGGGGAPSPFASGRGYTLVNLHPDNERSRLFAVNYQQAGLIPVCSEVEYVELGAKVFKFRVVSTNRVYEYVNHKAAAEPFPDHLARFFGAACPQKELGSLSEADRRGVREGKPLVGMTRRGVILAMGWPPRHANPDPNASSFLYWQNRFNKVRVDFGENGRVSAVTH